MNFEPRTILLPLAGNNADARTVSVRIMNELEPSPMQLGQLAHRFHLHMDRVRLSLAGFLTTDGTLEDGSKFRIVSNSGVHTPMLWPAGGGSESELADWFRAIPSSSSNLSGTGAKPSWGWKFPSKRSKLTNWPTAHKPISLRTDHPGHVTWSNPDLQVAKKPLVVAWRGPRDRYAATTGFGGADVGGIVAHERDPRFFPDSANALQLADDVLTDTGFVWINGHKIITGLQKVIAACLHQYDPAAHPGQFVLRVCTDRNPDGTRQLMVYDLVPTAGTDGATLKQIARAKTMAVKTSYTAVDNTNAANLGGGSPGAGKWDYWQRPHFNKSGTRLATIICLVGANGTDRESHAVSFDPTTWLMHDDVQATITVTDVTNNFSDVGSTGPWTVDYTDEQSFLIACDFEADTFVHMKLTVHVVTTQTGASEGAVAGSVYAGKQDRSHTSTYTLTHSAMGDLKAWTSTDVMHMEYHAVSVGSNTHYTGNWSWGVANATPGAIGVARAPKRPMIAFVGNLCARSFAVGYPKQDASTYTMSGTLDVTQANTLPAPSTPVSASRTRDYLVFDVYFDGVKILTAGTGAFTNASPESGSGTYSENMSLSDTQPTLPRSTTTNVNGAIARYGIQVSPVGPPSWEGRFGTAGDLVRAATYVYGAPALQQHCAVHPEKWAGYFGGAFYQETDLYGGTTPIPQGLELFALRANPDTDPTTENPLAYISGSDPTLSAPVFMGLGASNGATT